MLSCVLGNYFYVRDYGISITRLLIPIGRFVGHVFDPWSMRHYTEPIVMLLPI